MQIRENKTRQQNTFLQPVLMQLLFSGQTFGVCPLLQAVLIHNILAVYYQFYVFTSVTLCYSHSQSIALSRSFLTNYLSLITISVYFCLFKAHVSFLDTQYTSGMTRCILQYTGNFLTDENISTVAASTPNKPNGPSYTAKPKKKTIKQTQKIKINISKYQQTPSIRNITGTKPKH